LNKLIELRVSGFARLDHATDSHVTVDTVPRWSAQYCTDSDNSTFTGQSHPSMMWLTALATQQNAVASITTGTW